METQSRNFHFVRGESYPDEIPELSLLMKIAKELKVNLHLRCDDRHPNVWMFEYIENVNAPPGTCTLVLELLTGLADVHQKVMTGTAQYMSGDTSTPEWLVAWYERHGFRREARKGPGVPIERLPRALNPAALKTWNSYQMKFASLIKQTTAG